MARQTAEPGVYHSGVTAGSHKAAVDSRVLGVLHFARGGVASTSGVTSHTASMSKPPPKSKYGAPVNPQLGTTRTPSDRARFTTPSPEQIAHLKAEFLRLLAANGGIVVWACDQLELGTKTVYDWRKADPEFKLGWIEAVEQGTEVLEAEAVERAVHGHDRPVIYQGDITEWYKEKSDPMLLSILKSRSGRYSDKHEHTGPNGGPIPVTVSKIEVEVIDPRARAPSGSDGE